MRFRVVTVGTLLAIAAFVIPNRASAQTPPAGALFDLAVAHPAAFNGAIYTQFSTTFVATAASEYVSFAFREVPAYLSLDDVSVTLQGSSTNLLADPGYESDTTANVGTNFPVGWSRWIQAVDVSAIGEVASSTSNYGCDSGPHAGTYYWCDGSVQGYDALYQQLNGLTPGSTYVITWWVTDDSGSAITNPTIDLLVYAGTALPNGAVPIGPGPGSTPLPGSIWMMTIGLIGVGLYWWFGIRGRRVSNHIAKTLTVFCLCALLSSTALGAVADGRWHSRASDASAPKALSLRVSGNALSGTIDGVAITRGGVEGAYIWFQAVRNGVTLQYKGQISGSEIRLREVGPLGSRSFVLDRGK